MLGSEYPTIAKNHDLDQQECMKQFLSNFFSKMKVTHFWLNKLKI